LYAAVLRLRILCQRFDEDKKTLLANEGSVATILDRRLVFWRPGFSARKFASWLPPSESIKNKSWVQRNLGAAQKPSGRREVFLERA